MDRQKEGHYKEQTDRKKEIQGKQECLTAGSGTESGRFFQTLSLSSSYSDQEIPKIPLHKFPVESLSQAFMKHTEKLQKKKRTLNVGVPFSIEPLVLLGSSRIFSRTFPQICHQIREALKPKSLRHVPAGVAALCCTLHSNSQSCLTITVFNSQTVMFTVTVSPPVRLMMCLPED